MTSAVPNPESDFDRPDGSFWIKAYETALERLAALRAERDTLDAQLEQLNNEILRFEKVVGSLSPIASDGIRVATAVPTVEGISELGLADACREVLKDNPQYRTARGVRDSLVASGYNIAQHANPLASIHSILKRLAQSGEVEERESEGKTRYRWKNAPTFQGVTGVISKETLALASLEVRKAQDAAMKVAMAKVRENLKKKD